MNPAVGDIVIVPVTPPQNNGAKTAPAIVTRVWPGTDDSKVNVTVFPDCGDPVTRSSVAYVDSLDELSNAQMLFWSWPPPPIE
jgi:hypothetical protein